MKLCSRLLMLLVLPLPLLACNGDDKGDDDDDDGDDTGEVEEEGNYAPIEGYWEGEMVQEGFGPYFVSHEFVVDDAEVEEYVGEYLMQQYDTGYYCLYEAYHHSLPGDDQWMVKLVKIEDPVGACQGAEIGAWPNFAEDGPTLTLLEDGSLYRENLDGIASGVLYRESR